MSGRQGEERRVMTGQGTVRSGDINVRRMEELRQIEKDGGGVLQPEEVVAFARDPKTALHSAFEWDDTEAARQYRMEQARRLIRVIVEYVPHCEQPVRAFVSIRSERYEDGGYRHMPTLLRSKEGRAAVLATALWELDAFQAKYADLKELADVYAAIRSIKEKVK